MAWSTPITNRSQADINAQNSKAFLNVADWNRIYDNSVVVQGLFTSEIGYTFDFDTQSAQTTADVPTRTLLNQMLANIERMRFWSATYLGDYIFPDSLFVEIKDDWLDGHTNTAPNFTHVNSWEYVLLVMYNILSSWTDPISSGNFELFSGNDFELFDTSNLELFV